MGQMVGLLGALIKLWFPKLNFVQLRCKSAMCVATTSVPHESVRPGGKIGCETKVQDACCALRDAASQSSVSDPGAACLLSASMGLCSANMVSCKQSKISDLPESLIIFSLKIMVNTNNLSIC